MYLPPAKGRQVDATQEMLSLGLSNVLGALVGSFPVNASFGRTAVNAAAGVRSPLSGVFTGGCVLLALAFLTESCAFIPVAALSAVIVSVVIFSVEYEAVRPMWRESSE